MLQVNPSCIKSIVSMLSAPSPPWVSLSRSSCWIHNHLITSSTDTGIAGGGLFGFDISSMSGVLGTAAYTNYFNVHGGYRQGAITGAMAGGSFFGTLASSFIADRMSRKRAIQIAAVIWTIGSVYVDTKSKSPPYLNIG